MVAAERPNGDTTRLRPTRSARPVRFDFGVSILAKRSKKKIGEILIEQGSIDQASLVAAIN
jgi:hypothetical protein